MLEEGERRVFGGAEGELEASRYESGSVRRPEVVRMARTLTLKIAPESGILPSVGLVVDDNEQVAARSRQR